MQTTLKSRKTHLDFLKIIACFLVIVNHTNSVIFFSSEPSLEWFISLTYFYLSKIAVPIFLMCSGTVLLDKQDTMKKSFSRIFKIIMVIIIFSSLYYFKINPFSISTLFNFFKMIYKTTATNAFWYLYLYLGILLSLPFLQKMVINMKKTDYIYMICISIIFLGTMPIITKIMPELNYNGYINLNLFTTAFGLLFVGQYINKFFVYKKIYVILAIAIFIVSISISVSGTYYLYLRDSSNYLFFDNRWFITITAPAISLFYLVKCFYKKESKIITSLGKSTFGIFLLSDMFITFWQPKFNEIIFISNSLCKVIFLQITVFLSGLICTLILQKIPYIKKIL